MRSAWSKPYHKQEPELYSMSAAQKASVDIGELS